MEAGDGLAWIDEHKDYEGDECLIWPWARSTGGYGRIWKNGRLHNVSRLICIAAHGKPPTNKHHAAHSCGKGHEGCSNPRHLYWATASENALEKGDHGTAYRGEKLWNSKLTEDQVLQIYRIAQRGSLPQVEIARLFNIHQSTVSDIASGRRWSWLTSQAA